MRERFPSSNVHMSCVVEEDVEIGKGTLVGPFCFIRKGTRIGEDCKIGPLNVFEGHLSVGNHVRMGSHCNLGWYTTVGDYVFIAGHFTGANDRYMRWFRKSQPLEGYTIKYGARIGLGVIIMIGVTIGKEAVVGTGSLVTKDVEDRQIVYGHAATPHGYVDDPIIKH